MKPAIERSAARSRFEWEESGLTAVADYELAAGVMTVTHIIVPSALQGRGVATQLAEAVVEFARAEGLQVVPQCAFMAAYFARHAEARDVLGAS